MRCWFGRLSLVVCVLTASSGCATWKESQQVIEADGETFVACRDLVWIENETSGGLLGGGDLTFRVKFTDAAGLSHIIKGIKKLQ